MYMQVWRALAKKGQGGRAHEMLVYLSSWAEPALGKREAFEVGNLYI